MPSRLKVCLDLCHLHVGEFDLSTEVGRRGLMNGVDQLGAENVAALHVSDSYGLHASGQYAHAK